MSKLTRVAMIKKEGEHGEQRQQDREGRLSRFLDGPIELKE